MEFFTNVWKFLWEPIADTKGPKEKTMDTVDNALLGLFADYCQWCLSFLFRTLGVRNWLE